MPPEDTGQEKTEQPTPKRVREEQEKGNFARSKEITAVAIFLAMLLFLWLGQNYLTERIFRVLAFFLRFDVLLDLSLMNTTGLFWTALRLTLPILLPMFVLVFCVAIAAETGQVGIRSVRDAFEPKWGRLHPGRNLRRIFSVRQLAEGVKSVLKLVIYAIVAYLTAKDSLPTMSQLALNAPEQGLSVMTRTGFALGFRISVVLVFLAGFDYMFQRWQYYRQIRMTRQEIKDEIKQTEGDPLIKARVRNLQMEIARKRMMTAVPDSDVVVTNPTHYAVALRYDPEKDAAPTVVAKGQNYLAQKIREIAEEAGVPLVENPPLARAIYRQVEVGNPIPAALFKAVAQILASIWKLAEKRGRSWAKRPSQHSAHAHAQTPLPRQLRLAAPTRF